MFFSKQKLIAVFFLLLILTAGIFLKRFFYFSILPTNAQETEKVYTDIRINELFPNPKESPEKKYEYVELYNFGEEKIDLSGWKIKDKKTSFELSGELAPEDFIAFYDTVTLNNSDEKISLFNSETEVDSISYDKSTEDYSYSFDTDKKEWRWSSYKTPGEKNEFDKKIKYSDKIRINEFLPNPSGKETDDEYIELYNYDSEDLDLSGWILRDSSASGKYVFPQGTKIKSEDFLVVYGTDFDFTLNNADEKIYLFNPNEEEVFSFSYASSREDVSYNFSSEKNTWQQSNYLTPGKENKFNSPPVVKIALDKKFYKNIYANFKANAKDADKEELKYTWDFGDNHKSYKKETSHKYEKEGKYSGSLKVTDGVEDVINTFQIEVKKFPKKDVEIIALVPNPEGKDTDNEWILLKNNSEKKVNLKDWKIANGWDTLINHPINEKFEIKPGKTKKVTRKESLFFLNNKKSKLELHYPDGKTADEVKYNRKDSAQENETYQKTDDGWVWILENIVAPTSNTENEVVFIEENTKIFPEGEQSQEEAKKEKLKDVFISSLPQEVSPLLSDYQEKVLGVYTIKENGKYYLFTFSNYKKEEHYAIKFFKKSFMALNKNLLNFIEKH